MSLIDAALLAGRSPRAYLNPVPVLLTATRTNATTAFADITGLSVPLAAGVLYRIGVMLRFQSSSGACAPAFDLNGPAFTYYVASWMIPTSDTAAASSRQSRAYDVNTATAGVGTINVDYLALCTALIRPSAAGTLIGRFKRGASAGTISVLAGSSIVAEPLE